MGSNVIAGNHSINVTQGHFDERTSVSKGPLLSSYVHYLTSPGSVQGRYNDL